jgi:hypothetical protein
MLVTRHELQRRGLRTLAFICVLGLSVILLMVPTTSAGAGNPAIFQSSDSDTAVSPQYFGVIIPYQSPWPTIPFGSMRIDLNWLRVQPQPGTWDFARSDWFVEQAAAHNVELLFILGFTPRWASSTPDKACTVGTGTCGEPRDLNEWRNFLRTSANRYKGRVHYYELWNEPNDTEYYTGSIPGMVKLTQAASEVLKDVDPSNQIVSPSAVGPAGLKWLDQFLQAGGGKYVDIIGYHFYVSPAPPEGLVRYVQEIRTLMSNNGVASKPLWNTEIGWMDVNLGDFWQPAWLARTLILLRSAGISRSFWYAWGIRDGRLTLHLAKEDRVTPAPAGVAFKVLQDWMLGATVGPCVSNTDLPEPFKPAHGLWTCEIHRGAKVVRVVWSPDGNDMFTIPPNWGVKRLVDLYGASKPVPPGQILVGQQPILLATD